MTNIMRHSSATKAIIKLIHKNKSISLIIEDNGIGITRNDILNPEAFGIMGMRERCFSVGGKINFNNKDGTEVFAVFPLTSKINLRRKND